MAQEKPNWETVPPRDWGEKQAHRIAREIRRLRGKRTAQWVADRTKEMKYPLTRAVISDLEVGRRRYVTVPELMVLALALNTAPIALLYPEPYNEKIQVLPGNDNEFTKIFAVQWFSGLTGGVDSDGVGDNIVSNLLEATNTYDNTLALRRARKAQRLDELRNHNESRLRLKRENNAPAEEIAQLMSEIEELEQERDKLWALGSRNLDAERLDEMMGWGKSDGG